MTKLNQDINEQIYKDINNIINEFKEYKKSEYANEDKIQHEMIVAIIEACRANKYLSVRYY
jgi:hypothetical protein